MYVLLSVYLAHWKLVVVLRMHHNGEAAHTQHVGKRIMEVAAKGIKHVAHGNVLDMQVCSMRRRLECHHHQGVGELPTCLFLRHAEVLQDLMDDLHRVAVSLIVFTMQRYWTGVPNIVKGIKKFGKIVFMTTLLYMIVRSDLNSLTDGFRQQGPIKNMPIMVSPLL